MPGVRRFHEGVCFFLRRNAQKSTGPTTPDGKASSGFNALKHGIDAKQQIVFDESQEDLAHLEAEYRPQYLPANPAERFLVDTLSTTNGVCAACAA